MRRGSGTKGEGLCGRLQGHVRRRKAAVGGPEGEVLAPLAVRARSGNGYDASAENICRIFKPLTMHLQS